MQKETFTEDPPSSKEEQQERVRKEERPDAPSKPGRMARWMGTLAQMGLGESAIRLGTNVLSVLLALTVVWLMHTFYQQAQPDQGEIPAVGEPTPTPGFSLASLPMDMEASFEGVNRSVSLHTIIPNRPRLEVITYTVEQGDTVFGIAEKFGLNPETVLWGNYFSLRDDPHNLTPGQELNILPVNGTYYEWNAGDGLNGVAVYFGVEPGTIVNFPANHLDPQNIGDYVSPNIEPGTWLVIPGGKREFVTSWSAPIGVTRDNPAIAHYLGAGACGPISGGLIGFGTFIWPTDNHYLSGNDYSPESNHRGIDLSGNEGDPIYASDSGVIVYAGWNDYGYGNMIIIDHGRDWQTLYAHLSVINVSCGQSVSQGEIIAAMGSTGRSTGSHLHFEIMHTQYGKVNPWNLLP